MASPTFTINGSSISSGLVTVAGGATVTLALVSTAGIQTISWSCVGTHVASVTPASITALITPAGSPSGATATFTMPAGYGQSYRIKCVVRDVNNVSYTAYGLVGVLSESGFVPFAAGEETERHATQGWSDALNTLVGQQGTRSTATTTDATVTTIATVPIAAATIVDFKVRWFGQQSASPYQARRLSHFTVRRVASGAPAQVGSTVDLLASFKDDGTWGAMDFAFSGNNLIIRATGKAATTIDWKVDVISVFTQAGN